VGFNCHVGTLEIVGRSEPFAKFHLPEYEPVDRAIIEIADQQ
jgi:hypothetical protein